jgi:hypothetical protein
LKLSQLINVPKSSWVISHVNVEVKIRVSETYCLSIISDIDPDDGDFWNTGFQLVTGKAYHSRKF